MIVGRTPRTPVIGDTVLLRSGNRQASSSTPTRLGTEAIGAMRGQLSWHARRELAVPRLDYARRWP